jgi:hypothetical protein
VCVIDLTSEPDSLSELLELRAIIQARDDDQVQMKRATAPFTEDLPEMQYSPNLLKETSNLRLDVPLLLESFEDLAEVDMRVGCSFAGESDQTLDVGNPPDINDCSLARVFQESSITARRVVDHESLDTVGCVLRLPVPALNFDVAAAKWAAYGTVAERQYGFLRDTLADAFQLTVSRSCALVDTKLGWNPLPKGSDNIHTREPPMYINDEIEEYMLIKAPSQDPILGQAARLRLLVCFKVSRVDEQDLSLEDLSEMTSETVASCSESRFFTSSSEAVHQPGNGRSTNEQRTTPNSCITIEEDLSNAKGATADPLNILCSGALKRKRRHESELGVLQHSNEIERTGNLLWAFIQLRGQKHSRLNDPYATNFNQVRIAPDAAGQALAQVPKVVIGESPAFSPRLLFPENKACYITSLRLGRVILGHLDSHWPSELLIDRDYGRFEANTRPPGSVQVQGVIPLLCHDADVALTPCVGVVVTNLLKIAQKPLPGSKGCPTLRQHVEAVCGKYETVWVLVSENHASGEFSRPLSPADAGHYADFVRFTTTLPSECVPVFVPGATETLAKWILSLMCSYSPQALAYKDLLNHTEMSWELFLRRAGMNVTAAQVLAGSLSKYGNNGLSRFLAMSTQEKLTEFGHLVGKRNLVTTSQALDRRWH